MDFDVISDIHIEINDLANAISLIPKTSPILLIGGDITQATTNWDTLVAFLSVCCTSYMKVIYVLGNHEYYCNGAVKSSMQSIYSRIKSLESIFRNLAILEKEHIVFEKEQLIVFGATFWSAALESKFPSTYPIFSWVENHFKNITHSEWMELHYSSRVALERAIHLAKLLNYKLLVFTHFSPLVEEALDPKYHTKANNDLYCTDMDKYFHEVDFWIFGHSGYNCDVTKKRCRIFSNQSKTTSGPKYIKGSFFI